MEKRKWTIQISYDANSDDGKRFRARAVFQTEAKNVSEAYKLAEEVFKGRTDLKLGAIIPGHHAMVP